MKKQRLLALDVLRGMTIGGMILVNSAGNWGHVYAPLSHSSWNGMTTADMIFPLFMFMMGISMYISLKKFSFELHKALLMKILRRTCLIFLIGVGIYAVATYLNTGSLSGVRILGVLQRLALCYGIGALTVTTVRHRYIPYLIIALLLSYYMVLLLGNGFVYGPENILSYVDCSVLGMNHIYNDRGIDPEGILSTLPSIAHVLTGFCFGKICMEVRDMKDKLNKLFLYGSICLLLGFALQDLCPINKKVWSPTFVGVTCGFSALLLAVLMWFIDVTGQYKRTRFWEVFGMNSLFCYVMSQLLYILADTLPLFGKSVHGVVYSVLSGWVGDNAFASLLYACLFVGVVWLVGRYLYAKKIYIKI